MRKLIAAAACLAMVSGCANIGTVNGVQIGQKASEVPQPKQRTFCDRNPLICVAGGVAAVAVGAIVIVNANGS